MKEAVPCKHTFPYNNATVDVKASECLQCGNCEAACPQGIEIIDWLRRAAHIFEE